MTANTVLAFVLVEFVCATRIAIETEQINIERERCHCLGGREEDLRLTS
jgi:hypothetical protein